jgi:hypothetical protein
MGQGSRNTAKPFAEGGSEARLKSVVAALLMLLLVVVEEGLKRERGR